MNSERVTALGKRVSESPSILSGSSPAMLTGFKANMFEIPGDSDSVIAASSSCSGRDYADQALVHTCAISPNQVAQVTVGGLENNHVPTKSFPYVPPRIDPELYQATVPKWCGGNIDIIKTTRSDESKCMVEDTFKPAGSPAVFLPNYASQKHISEFIAVARSIFECTRPSLNSLVVPDMKDENIDAGSRKGGVHISNNTGTSDRPDASVAKQFDWRWTADSVASTALESDALLMEYLAQHEYDVNKAWIQLCCDLSHGKGLLNAELAMGFIDHTASNLLWSEWRDRQYQFKSVQPLLGQLHAPFYSFDPLESAHSASNELAERAMGSSLNRRSLLSSSAIVPRVRTLHGVAVEDGDIEAAAQSQDDVTSAGIDSNKKNSASEDNIDDVNGSGNSVPSSIRTAPHRGAAKQDKLEGRRRWVLLLRSVSAVLEKKSHDELRDYFNHAAAAVGAQKLSSEVCAMFKSNRAVADRPARSLSNAVAGVSGAAAKACLSDAQRLLEEAVVVSSAHPDATGSYSSHGANVSSTEFYSAADENSLVESSRTLLGELVKATMRTRCWVAESQTALSTCRLSAWETADTAAASRLKSTAASNQTGSQSVAATTVADRIVHVGSEVRQLFLGSIRKSDFKTVELPSKTRRILMKLQTLAASADELVVSEPLLQLFLYDSIATASCLLEVANIFLQKLVLWERQLLLRAAKTVGTGALLENFLVHCFDVDAFEKEAFLEGTVPVVTAKTTAATASAASSADKFYELRREFSNRRLYPTAASQFRRMCISESQTDGDSEISANPRSISDAAASRSKLVELELLLRKAVECPIKIKEMPYIYSAYRRAQMLAHAAATVLHRCGSDDDTGSILSQRKAASGRFLEVSEVEQLCCEICELPFAIDEHQPLQQLLEAAVKWRMDVLAMKSTDQQRDKVLGDTKPVPLALVEAMITEGERFPFNFTAEIDILKEKKSMAKVLQDKMRNFKVRTKAVSHRRLQQSAGAGSATDALENMAGGEVGSKPSVGEVQEIVALGNILYQPPPAVAQNAPGQNRDLQQWRTVLDNVEGFRSRMNDLILSKEEEDRLIADDAHELATNGAIADAAALSSSDDDDEEGEEEEEEEDSSEEAREALTSMLLEAEAMPVAMEETVLIRCQLSALDWAEKAKPLMSHLLDDRTCESSRAADGAQQLLPSLVQRPRLIELQQLSKEINRIRATVPEHLKQAYSMRPLRAETCCIDIVARAERLLGRARKIMQNNSSVVRKGISIDKLRQLYHEATSLGINIDYEMRPVRSAIEAFEEWTLRNWDLLTCLVPATLLQQSVPAAAIDKAGTTTAVTTVASLSEAQFMVNQASHLAADSELVRYLVRLVRDIEKWKAKVDCLCNRSSLPLLSAGARRSSSSSGNTLSVTASEGLPRKRKRDGADSSAVSSRYDAGNLSSDNDADVDVSANADVDIDADKASDEGAQEENDNVGGSAANDDALSSFSTSGIDPSNIKLLSISEVESLVSLGRSFPIDFTEEIETLEKLLCDAAAYCADVNEFLCGQLPTDIDAAHESVLQQLRINPLLREEGPGALVFNKVAAQMNVDVPASTNNQQQQVEEDGCAVQLAGIMKSLAEHQKKLWNFGVQIDQQCCERLALLDGAFLWMVEVLRLVKTARVSRKLVDLPFDSLISSSSSSSALRYSQPQEQWCWEMLKEPVLLSDAWADVDARLLLSLLREGATLKSLFVGRDTVEQNCDVDLVQDSSDSDELSFSSAFQGTALENVPSYRAVLQFDTLNETSVRPEDDISGTAIASATTAAAAQEQKAETRSSLVTRKRKPKTAATLGDDCEGAASNAQPGSRKKSKLSSTTEATNESEVQQQQQQERSSATAATDVDATIRMRRFMKQVILATSKTSEQIALTEADAANSFPKSLSVIVDYFQRCLLLFIERWHSAQLWARCAKEVVEGISRGVPLLSLTAKVTSVANYLLRRDTVVASAECADSNALKNGSSDFVVSAENRALGGEAVIILELLNIAEKSHIEMKQRRILAEKFESSKQWLQQMASLRNGTSPGVSLSAMEALLAAGESNLFTRRKEQEQQFCRGELRKARTWVKKLRQSGVQIDDVVSAMDAADSASSETSAATTTTAASAEHMEELLREAESLRIDLTEFTEKIEQANTCYCLCRQLYFGQMVGCDTCEDWYHFVCVGLSVNQAEKCDKYVCIRCAVKQSFMNAANAVADVSNKWMNCMEHFRVREHAFQKITKKIAKEERDLQKSEGALLQLLTTKIGAERAHTELSQLQDAIGVGSSSATEDIQNRNGSDNSTCAQTSPKNENENISDRTALEDASATANIDIICDSNNRESNEASVAATEPIKSTDKFPELHAEFRDVRQARTTLMKSRDEKQRLVFAIALETRLHQDIARWMQALQDIIWPTTAENIALGRPLGLSAVDVKTLPNSSSCALRAAAMLAAAHALNENPNSVLARNRLLTSHLHAPMLPAALLHLEKAASAVGIISVEDVNTALHLFKWMSWCNLCLHTLQVPPTTPTLRRLLNSARSVCCAEDKIVKQLQGVLQRSSAWKSKARKTLVQQTKKVDFGKLQALAIDGNSLPFTSRMKEGIQDVMSTFGASFVASDSAISTKSNVGRPSKKATMKSEISVDYTHSGPNHEASSSATAAAVLASSSQDGGDQKAIERRTYKKRSHDQRLLEALQECGSCYSSDEEDVYEEAVQMQLKHQLELQNSSRVQDQSDLSPELQIQRDRLQKIQQMIRSTSRYRDIRSSTKAKEPGLIWPARVRSHRNNYQESPLLAQAAAAATANANVSRSFSTAENA